MATYVCSDIHGNYKKWKQMLRRIKFKSTDTMYILGDVVDRGDEPIPLLLDILSRKNCVLLMGNHEKMMLDFYKAKSKFDTIDTYRLWIQNGGEVTYEHLNELSKEEQAEILSKIESLPLAIIGLSVDQKKKNGQIIPRTYYLVHASPGRAFYSYPSTLTLNNTIEASQMLWDRAFYRTGKLELSLSQQNFYKDFTVINGHTPTTGIFGFHQKFSTDNFPKNFRGRILHSHKGHAINVDCGIYHRKSVFGCLRLDDWAEFYIE
jgi:serine/threonine protein phosphatase 1